MDASQPPRLQYAHKFRRKVIHLLKELAVVLIMSEIIIGRSVLIVVGKRDAGYNQIYRIIFHLLTFKNIVVIDRFPKFTEFFLTTGEHPPHHLLFRFQPIQSVFTYYAGHLGYHLLMLCPFLHEALVYLSLAFRIDQVEVNWMFLHESVDTGYRLELIVETVVDKHDCLVTVVLEVQTLTKHFGFSCKVFQTAIFEIRYSLSNTSFLCN